MDTRKNYGLIETSPQEGEEIFGSVSSFTKPLCPDRNWLKYRPINEYQNKGFETYACVTFSAWNCLETLFKKQFKRSILKSDRFTATLSGTKDKHGNYLNIVADCIKKNWSPAEKEYPFGGENYDEFYQPLDPKLKKLALKEKGKYQMDWHWVGWAGVETEALWGALRFSPVQVTVLAWEKPKNGLYRRSKSEETNHAVTLLSGVYGAKWTIFDHYDAIIKDLAWDFYFGSAVGFSLKK